MELSTLTPLLNALTVSVRRPSHLHHAARLPITTRRGHKTARRNRKALNIPPAPSLGGPPVLHTGSSGRSHLPRHTPLPQGDTIVFNPPSSAPNVYHTPALFLPREDPRRQLLLKHQARGTAAYSSVPAATSDDGTQVSHLPAPVSPLKDVKRYHLKPEDIEEMRRLRKEDSAKWTRQKLADKFECSNFFVATVVHANDEWRAKEKKRIKEIKRFWGPKKRKAREDRRRRKDLWGRDA